MDHRSTRPCGNTGPTLATILARPSRTRAAGQRRVYLVSADCAKRLDSSGILNQTRRVLSARDTHPTGDIGRASVRSNRHKKAANAVMADRHGVYRSATPDAIQVPSYRTASTMTSRLEALFPGSGKTVAVDAARRPGRPTRPTTPVSPARRLRARLRTVPRSSRGVASSAKTSTSKRRR